jgi:hypothetical protein
MGGPRDPAHLAVVAGPLVLVGHKEADGRPQGNPVFHTGKDGHTVRLLAIGGQLALARSASIQLRLDVRLTKCHARRASVEHSAHAFAVGFAEGRDFQKGSKSTGHGTCSCLLGSLRLLGLSGWPTQRYTEAGSRIAAPAIP